MAQNLSQIKDSAVIGVANHFQSSINIKRQKYFKNYRYDLLMGTLDKILAYESKMFKKKEGKFYNFYA